MVRDHSDIHGDGAFRAGVALASASRVWENVPENLCLLLDCDVLDILCQPGIMATMAAFSGYRNAISMSSVALAKAWRDYASAERKMLAFFNRGYMLELDEDKQQWVEHPHPVPTGVDGLSDLSGYTCCSANGFIYVLGGRIENDSDGVQYASAFWRYDTLSQTWDRLPDMPIARAHDVAVINKGMLTIMGDCGDEQKVSMDHFDLSTWSWGAPTHANFYFEDYIDVIPVGGSTYALAFPEPFVSPTLYLVNLVTEEITALKPMCGHFTGCPTRAFMVQDMLVALVRFPDVEDEDTHLCTYDLNLQTWSYDGPVPLSPHSLLGPVPVEVDDHWILFDSVHVHQFFPHNASWKVGPHLPEYAAEAPVAAFLLQPPGAATRRHAAPVTQGAEQSDAAQPADPPSDAVIQEVDHPDVAQPADPPSDALASNEMWAQYVQQQDLFRSAVPSSIEPIMCLKFKGNAELLREKLGQDLIMDCRILEEMANDLNAIIEKLAVRQSRMVSPDGQEALQKILVAVREANGLRAKTNDAQQELASIAQRQHFKDLTPYPSFANGASVFVTPHAASELEIAVRESEVQLGRQHLLVSESLVPYVRAAVEVEKAPGDRRRNPKEDVSNRIELPRAALSPEVAQACREEDMLEETGVLMQDCGTSSDGRLTHSTGSMPRGATWSFGPARKHFHLPSMPQMT